MQKNVLSSSEEVLMGSFPHQVFLSRNTEKHKQIQNIIKLIHIDLSLHILIGMIQ